MADLMNPTADGPGAPRPITYALPLPDEGPVGPPPPAPGEENDPFRFGWRYIRRALPDGGETYDQVPLTWYDLLYPEEEDFVVERPVHQRDYCYCHEALKVFHQDDPSVVVLGVCRIDFGVRGLRPLGPDVVVLFGVRQWLWGGTFEVAVEGGRPVVVIEVASPGTYDHDLRNKPDLYYRAGVEKYVIVDRGRRGDKPARLLAYGRGPQGWVPLPADGRGRIDLAPMRVLIGLEDDRPWLYDAATGERLPDLAEAMRGRADAEAKARDEARARADAEAVARDALAKARDEAQVRADALARARDEAEARARDALAVARDALAMARDAEAKARDESERRAALEERLRLLEEQLRRQAEQG